MQSPLQQTLADPRCWESPLHQPPEVTNNSSQRLHAANLKGSSRAFSKPPSLTRGHDPPHLFWEEPGAPQKPEPSEEVCRACQF